FQKFGSVYGDGLGDGTTPGAHYGSGMSVLGGSIRSGELTSSEPIRHALKFLVYAKKYLYYSSSLPGYKWPAKLADNYANDPNNPNRYQGTNTNLVMGSLVAIPGWRTVNDLQLSSPKARKIAQALLDYGAYIVDDTAYTNYAFGISQEEVGQWDIPQSDLRKIVSELWVVTNNAPNSIGGKVNGGLPRVGYAPNF
ncbi:MAG: hypothetical protein H7Y38_17460, partial [Armatimonadetes bacterium]|nr:hypothetical protein [Armatimonadota bacterium]